MKIFTVLLPLWIAYAAADLGHAANLKAFDDDISPNDNYKEVLKLRHLAVEFFDYYQNITIKDINSKEITEQECLADLETILKGLETSSIWAMRMIDAWGWLPSGILYGNLKNLGNYDECLSINRVVTYNRNIVGKYCFANVPIGSLLLNSSALDVKVAICIPTSCSASTMDTLIRQLYLEMYKHELNQDMEIVDETSCRTMKVKEFDGVTIFTIVILSVLAIIVLLATLWDYLVDEEKHPDLVGVFSARANSRSLFRIMDGKLNPNIIDCLHGMRCLSLMWVIFFHDYMLTSSLPIQNLVDVYAWSKTAFSSIFRQGTFAVDTFFFITGLLLAFGGLRTVAKSKGKVNVPMMYLHRYLRLTPVVAVAILVYMKILPLMGDGPLSNGYFEGYNGVCQRTWFWTLLYLQNYVTTDLCLSHTWYLAADMQLYIVSVLLVITLYKWGNRAAAGIVVLILLLSACLFCEIAILHYSIHDRTTSQKIYYATHLQASPFFIGLLFGYFLHLNRGRAFKLQPFVVWLGWLIGIGLMFTCVFATCGYDGITKTLPYLEEAFHLSLARIAWPLGLSWMVFACMQGYGGPINSFLSSPLWQPLSKLSYCIYIFHMIFVSLNMGITRSNVYFSDYNVMLRFWGDFGFSIILSYFMYILIEVPFSKLEALLLSTRRKPSPTEVTPKETVESSEPITETTKVEE